MSENDEKVSEDKLSKEQIKQIARFDSLKKKVINLNKRASALHKKLLNLQANEFTWKKKEYSLLQEKRKARKLEEQMNSLFISFKELCHNNNNNSPDEVKETVTHTSLLLKSLGPSLESVNLSIKLVEQEIEQEQQIEQQIEKEKQKENSASKV